MKTTPSILYETEMSEQSAVSIKKMGLRESMAQTEKNTVHAKKNRKEGSLITSTAHELGNGERANAVHAQKAAFRSKSFLVKR
jgi:hypothetical protein